MKDLAFIRHLSDKWCSVMWWESQSELYFVCVSHLKQGVCLWVWEGAATYHRGCVCVPLLFRVLVGQCRGLGTWQWEVSSDRETIADVWGKEEGLNFKVIDGWEKTRCDGHKEGRGWKVKKIWLLLWWNDFWNITTVQQTLPYVSNFEIWYD